MEGQELRVIATANPDYEIRYEELEGTRYMVVPVVMMREGVHSGSGGAVYYPPDVFGNLPQTWNGVPVMVDHPLNTDGTPSLFGNSPSFTSQVVGRIYNAAFNPQTTVLSADAWINEERIQEISPAAYNAIIAKRPLNVSTGSLSGVTNEPGQWKNESFEKSLKGWIPDHLALLPVGRGACNWEDGCGVGILNEESKLEDTNVEITKFPFDKEQKTIYYQVYVNAGYKVLVNMIASKLDAMDSAERIHFLEDVYQDYFVYRVGGRNIPSQYFKRSYEYSETNNTLEFTGIPEQVSKKIDYVAVSNTDKGGQEQVSKECKCSETKVLALIEASDTFTSEDKETLMTFSEEKIDSLTTLANSAKENKTKGGEDKTTSTETKEITLEEATEVVAKNMKPDQMLKMLPTDVQESIQIGLDSHKEKHATLVNELKDVQSEFTEEELKTMKVPHLERLAKAIGSAKPTLNYSGVGAGILSDVSNAGDSEEVLPLPLANKGGTA